MKLSEAILLGIGFVNNDRECFFRVVNGVPCGCAIGTALFAVGRVGRHQDDSLEVTRSIWPWTAQASTYPFPDKGGCGDQSIAREISTRHSRGESRESLAALVATIEPVEARPAPAPVEGVEVGG